MGNPLYGARRLLWTVPLIPEALIMAGMRTLSRRREYQATWWQSGKNRQKREVTLSQVLKVRFRLLGVHQRETQL